MSRIAILPYGVSESATILKDTLNEISSSRMARKLRLSGSAFVGNRNDLVVNWGSGNTAALQQVLGTARVLNNTVAVNTAANKVSALTTLREAGVSTVEFTTSQEEAQQWLNSGEGVFARTELRGHSGSGIIYCNQNVPQDLGNVEHSTDMVSAELYTKHGALRNREYRIHVFQGSVIFVQQKRRQAGYRDNPDYSNIVRNHGNGWIYAHSHVTNINQEVVNTAINAVNALGLDFGAVDIVTYQNQCQVLEVNTAPGQSGDTTRVLYATAILQAYNRETIAPSEAVINLLANMGVIPTLVTQNEAVVEESNEAVDEGVADLTPTADTSLLEELNAVDVSDHVARTTVESTDRLPSSSAITDNTYWVPATMLGDNIEEGTRVRISRSSTYFGSHPLHNPTNEFFGTIRASAFGCHVDWSDSNHNPYEPADLWLKLNERQQLNITLTPLTSTNFSVGDVVQLRDSSRFFNTSDSHNPGTGVYGTIVRHTAFQVVVQWELFGGNLNHYTINDLFKVGYQVQTEAPEVVPVSIAPNLPEGFTAGENFQGDAATGLVNNGVYLASISGVQTFVQYLQEFNSYYTFGFDIMIPSREVTVISRLA